MLQHLLVLLLVVGHAYAGEGDRLLKDARDTYASADFWQVDFTNTFVWELAGDTVSNAGSLLLAPEGAFRVDMEGAHLLSDGTRLWRWEEGSGQVLQETLNSSQDVILPHQFLAHLDDRFNPGRVSDLDGDTKRLELQVKGDSDFMRQVFLVLRRESGHWQPGEIEFVDAGDNWNQYRITGRQSWSEGELPGTLADKLKMELPTGYELLVLDEVAE